MNSSPLETLQQKLHPSNFTEMSGKMAAIVAFILEAEWTEPALPALYITDDLLGTWDCFLGAVANYVDNRDRLLQVAGCTAEEVQTFHAQELRRIEGNRALLPAPPIPQ